MTLSEKSRTRKVIECNHPKQNELSVTTSSSSSGLGSVRHSKTYNFDKVCIIIIFLIVNELLPFYNALFFFSSFTNADFTIL